MSNAIKFDFTNYSDGAVGEHGISDNLLASLSDKAQSIHADMASRRTNGELPYRDLPYQNIDDIVDFGSASRGKFDNFVTLGIGGSALGSQALTQALCHPYHNLLSSRPDGAMKMFFADNIDPDNLSGMFDVAPPEKTLYNIITKSGSTAETMSAFLLAKERLEKVLGASWKNNVVITTDVSKGDLRAIADSEGIPSFIVPDGVGGRFSVFTSVGLIPAVCAGIDIKSLLAGAAAMDKRIESSDILDNPAYLYAMYQHLLDVKNGKPISVMMPYSSAMYGLADWFRQLWAESLGKRLDLEGNEVFVGPTPVKALGVTDQHSQVQLYIEGPIDKAFTLLAVESFDNELPIKSSYNEKASLEYLGNRTLAELMEAERLGTVYALTSAQRPNMTISFPEISAHTIGQFLYALEVATVFSGGLYNIDPLDQPGVEAGKIAAFALMGRKGYEDKAAEIRNGVKSNAKYLK